MAPSLLGHGRGRLSGCLIFFSLTIRPRQRPIGGVPYSFIFSLTIRPRKRRFRRVPQIYFLPFTVRPRQRAKRKVVLKNFFGKDDKKALRTKCVHRAIVCNGEVLLIYDTNCFSTLSRVYTRMNTISFYSSLCIMFNKEMSNTSNRYGFPLWRATNLC